MRAAAIALVLLTGCDRQATTTSATATRQGAEPNWRARYSRQECAALTERNAVLRRCFGGVFAQENYVGRFRCLPYSPRRQFTGVWVLGFEHSSFFPGATRHDRGQSDITLTFEPMPPPEAMPTLGPDLRAYAVRLVGRRSLCDDHYGHLGSWRQEIVAERIISIRPLPGPNR